MSNTKKVNQKGQYEDVQIFEDRPSVPTTPVPAPPQESGK